ncbi:hypothetical protein XM38_034150 [Halomicronema hongdechloris C2206]|uniref:PEP-CTERM protein-sorting domain-containing protein n=1 Tax=Halomicronema hongdechloris C2206 TaxID=1641165 RepID=A0A1V8NMJ7_9CYAN|nr:PEP-CTERM sorting domain-containing protein [Halomicronema hongdechloris]ASC72458.1 hypothetical protein XM38_034150 [Halomicronema hongdechloris C2206]
MKRFALAATAALGLTALATPARAASWTVDYTGWWENDGGGAISGTISADDAAAQDGIISLDELTSWAWDWSGNSAASAFSFSSDDPAAEIQIVDPTLDNGFYINGTPNQPLLADDLDQGVFAADEFSLDLEFLFVDNFETGEFSEGLSQGAVSVAEVDTDAESVPEPAMILGLFALTGAGATTLRRQQQDV